MRLLLIPFLALAAYGTDLYVPGSFTSIGTSTGRYIARLDTAANTWHALGTGLKWYGSQVGAALTWCRIQVGTGLNRCGTWLARPFQAAHPHRAAHHALARGQLYGFWVALAQKSTVFSKRPKRSRIGNTARLKDKVFSIRSPVAAALCRGTIPIRQQGVQLGSVRSDFPQ